MKNLIVGKFVFLWIFTFYGKVYYRIAKAESWSVEVKLKNRYLRFTLPTISRLRGLSYWSIDLNTVRYGRYSHVWRWSSLGTYKMYRVWRVYQSNKNPLNWVSITLKVRDIHKSLFLTFANETHKKAKVYTFGFMKVFISISFNNSEYTFKQAKERPISYILGFKHNGKW